MGYGDVMMSRYFTDLMFTSSRIFKKVVQTILKMAIKYFGMVLAVLFSKKEKQTT